MSDDEDIIRHGRARVRLIEAIDVLVEKERRPEDRAVLEQARQFAKPTHLLVDLARDPNLLADKASSGSVDIGLGRSSIQLLE